MTAVEWLVDKIMKAEFINDTDELIRQAKELESYNAKVEAKKYYL